MQTEKDFEQYGPSTPAFNFDGYHTIARVVGISDGDSIIVTLPLPTRSAAPCVYKFHIRLDGIDTPEMRGGGEAAINARNRLLQLITGVPLSDTDLLTKKHIQNLLSNEVHLVRLECGDFDKYGRVLANVFKPHEHMSFSQILLDEGLAKEYHGGKKTW
jgi:endonuclease YncB( thermonuclease family)